jgi:hypothetical protein
MLFRLRMSIDQAISAYVEITSHVFSQKKWPLQEGTFKASRLEEGIIRVIAATLKVEEAEAVTMRMLNDQFPDEAKG